MDKHYIQQEAYKLQKEIWENKDVLWPNLKPSLINMLHPKEACRLLGINYQEFDSLGRFGYKGSRFESAGIINRKTKEIAVSNKFKSEMIRFTAAHELGHWILHPNEIMHHDRPINNLEFFNEKRPDSEREADYFAACFLMPYKLLKTKFEETFLTNVPLHIDENTAFWLNQVNPDTLLYADEERLDREIAVAFCQSYKCRHIHSLASQFKVSITAMAIRLKELEFIKWP